MLNICLSKIHMHDIVYVYNWLPLDGAIAQAGRKSISQSIFPRGHSPHPLAVGAPDNTSALCSEVILSSKLTNQKHKNMKNVALKLGWKISLVYIMRSETCGIMRAKTSSRVLAEILGVAWGRGLKVLLLPARACPTIAGTELQVLVWGCK